MGMQRQLRVLPGKEGGELTAEGIRVAFATSDLRRIDQHFGSAERFTLYQIEPGRSTLLMVSEFGSLAQDGNENKLLEKFVVLDGCAAVYCLAVGASAVRQLVGMGVQPVKVSPGATIPAVLDELQRQLRDGPAGWLARVLARDQQKDPDRFEQMLEDGWED